MRLIILIGTLFIEKTADPQRLHIADRRADPLLIQPDGWSSPISPAVSRILLARMARNEKRTNKEFLKNNGNYGILIKTLVIMEHMP